MNKKDRRKVAKENYWKKKYDNADWVECACGCGDLIKNIDKYGRSKRFVSGHNNRKYQDKGQYKREWNHRNRQKRMDYKISYGRDRKVKLIKKMGGSCSVCGLNYDGENGAAFDLHHRDPDKKEFPLNISTLTNKAWIKILIEAEKCDLICSNCHRKLHFGGF